MVEELVSMFLFKGSKDPSSEPPLHPAEGELDEDF